VGLRSDDYLRSTSVRQVGVTFFCTFILCMCVCMYNIVHILYMRKTAERDRSSTSSAPSNDYYYVITLLLLLLRTEMIFLSSLTIIILPKRFFFCF